MIHHGDLFDVLPTLDADSIDACVTDPPYGLGFMAKDWDVPGGIAGFPMRRRVETDAVNTGASRQGGRQRSGPDFAKRQKRDAQAFEAEAERWALEVFRVLKPGAHCLVFGGTRMYHRMAAGIEDAGFEIRDCLSWLYGQGFPKSLNLPGGLGTALKPAWEPIILARKPTRGTVAANVAEHGTGALNIDDCRIGTDSMGGYEVSAGGMLQPSKQRAEGYRPHWDREDRSFIAKESTGRWPANVLLDEEAAAAVDEASGEVGGGYGVSGSGPLNGRTSYAMPGQGQTVGFGDIGGASRFFKTAESDCLLCGVRSVERATMNTCETTSASSAEQRSRIIRQTIGATALQVAHASLVERIVLAAPSVESLCETCVTSIALALVEVKSTGSERAALRAFPGSMPSYKSSILIQNLACFAGLWANIDIIPTTDSLSLLFGSVVHAIENSTKQESPKSDSGPQRFLYSAKPSREERDYGCHSIAARTGGEATDRADGTAGLNSPRAGAGRTGGSRNVHPTVKPIALMRYLVKLVTPPGGTVLDPFTGSGTTGMACRYEDRQFIGVEREAEYVAIALARIAAVAPLFGEATA